MNDIYKYPPMVSSFHELISRAVQIYELETPITPIAFLVWTDGKGLDIPDKLIRAIESCPGYVDWKAPTSSVNATGDDDAENSDTQSSKQKKSEHDQNLQKVANHVGRDLTYQWNRRPNKEEVAKTMIKILDGEYPTEKDIIDLLKTNVPNRKPNKDDAFFSTILRRIRSKW